MAIRRQSVVDKVDSELLQATVSRLASPWFDDNASRRMESQERKDSKRCEQRKHGELNMPRRPLDYLYNPTCGEFTFRCERPGEALCPDPNGVGYVSD